MEKTYSTAIQFQTSSMRLFLSKNSLDLIISAVTTSKNEWIEISDENGHCWVKRDEIVAIRSGETKEPGRLLRGVSIAEICEVSKKWKYPTLVRKVNRTGGIKLEMVSARRIKLTSENFQALELTEAEILKLKKIENGRSDNNE